MGRIYLDHVATTPTDPRVIKSMLPYLKKYWGNPQSLHSIGSPAAKAIEEARHQVCELINGYPCEIIFTSSGTEATNLALKGVAWALKDQGNHIITSKIEHHAVLHPLKFLEKQGFEVTQVGVDKHGLVDPDEIADAITKKTILVSVHHANHEIGTIEPLQKISKICHEQDILFHTDAVSSVGTIPVDVKKLGVDLLSLSAHRFYGPKGAALFVRKGVRLIPLIHGGVQEGGKRAGTENVPGIVGLGKAAEIAKKEIPKRVKKMTPLRDQLAKGLNKIGYVKLNGHPKNRLPTHVNVSVGYVEGESLLALLDQEGISAASGSACTSKALKASHVLSAIDVPIEFINGTLLFSLGKDTTKSDINYVLKKMPSIVKRMRSISPLWRDKITGRKTEYTEHSH
jgi:cysteine desulfurase